MTIMGCSNYSGNKAGELLDAQAHVLSHQYSFIRSMSLKYAVQLGIPDVIHKHGKPMTIQELAVPLSIQPKKIPFLQRLMRTLTHSGYFSEQQIGGHNHQHNENQATKGYVLTTSSQLLLKDSPVSVVPYLLPMFEPNMMKPWLCQVNWLQNGDEETPFQAAHGTTMYDHAGNYPEFNSNFNDRMAGDSRLFASLLIDEEYKQLFDGLDTLVDVGGGTGEMAKAIASAYPDLKCVVLDLPHVVDGLKGSSNLNYVAGNMFEGIPDTDAVLLKWTLHNWNDEECVKILKLCRKAIQSKKGKGGKVLVIDIVIDESCDRHELRETQLFYDMLMMTLLTGKERREGEWKKLFIDAGFTKYKIISLPGFRSLVEIYP